MQDEMDCMNFLEDDVLGIKGRFIPLASSATQSAEDSATDGEAGRPEMAAEELTESGRENKRGGVGRCLFMWTARRRADYLL